MILYACGAAGKSKGVLLSHVIIDPHIRSPVSYWRWSLADKMSHTLPLYHTRGIVNNALICPPYVDAR